MRRTSCLYMRLPTSVILSRSSSENACSSPSYGMLSYRANMWSFSLGMNSYPLLAMSRNSKTISLSCRGCLCGCRPIPGYHGENAGSRRYGDDPWPTCMGGRGFASSVIEASAWMDPWMRWNGQLLLAFAALQSGIWHCSYLSSHRTSSLGGAAARPRM